MNFVDTQPRLINIKEFVIRYRRNLQNIVSLSLRTEFSQDFFLYDSMEAIKLFMKSYVIWNVKWSRLRFLLSLNLRNSTNFILHPLT